MDSFEVNTTSSLFAVAKDAAGNAIEDVTIEYTSENEDIAAILDGELHAMGEGTVTLTATLADNGKYEAKAITKTVTVTAKLKTPLTLSWAGEDAEKSNFLPNGMYELYAVAKDVEDVKDVKIAYTSSGENIAYIVDNKLLTLAEGTVTLTATLVENDYYKADAITKEITVFQPGKIVAKCGEAVIEGEEADIFVNDVVTLTTDEGAKLSVKMNEENPDEEYNISNVADNKIEIKFLKENVYVFDVTSLDAEGKELVTRNIALMVSKRDSGIKFDKVEAVAYLDNLDSFEAPELINEYNLPLTWESDNNEVATVDESGKIDIKAAGETMISVKFAGNDEYNSAEEGYILTVEEDSPTPTTYTYTYDFVNNNYGHTIYEGNGDDFDKEGQVYESEHAVALTTIGETRIYKNKDKEQDFRLRKGIQNGFTVSVTEGFNIKKINVTCKEPLKFDGSNSTSSFWENTKAEIRDSVKVVNGSSSSKAAIKTITITYEGKRPAHPIMKAGETQIAHQGKFYNETGVCEVVFEHGEDGYVHDYKQVYVNMSKNMHVYDPATGEEWDVDPENSMRAEQQTLDENQILGEDGKVYTLAADNKYKVINGGEISYMTVHHGGQSKVRKASFYVPTGVEGITVDAEAEGEAVYYNLQGVRVAEPTKGIYIRVVNGKAKKVMK
ncbi:MAG: hypothetical protein NC204_00770 [Candidatus Amulumruptor caecigallinarius]|nr:hypothetical protein [Candidatus Amulumruptor caecigallinarius]